MTKKNFKGAGTELFLSPQQDKASEQSEQHNNAIVSDNTINNAVNNTSDTTINDISIIKKNNINSNTKPNTLTNILNSIKTEKPAGANYTFFLREDTAAAIADTANKKKISRSKLVDTILRQVLLGEV